MARACAQARTRDSGSVARRSYRERCHSGSTVMLVSIEATISPEFHGVMLAGRSSSSEIGMSGITNADIAVNT